MLDTFESKTFDLFKKVEFRYNTLFITCPKTNETIRMIEFPSKFPTYLKSNDIQVNPGSILIRVPYYHSYRFIVLVYNFQNGRNRNMRRKLAERICGLKLKPTAEEQKRMDKNLKFSQLMKQQSELLQCIDDGLINFINEELEIKKRHENLMDEVDEETLQIVKEIKKKIHQMYVEQYESIERMIHDQLSKPLSRRLLVNMKRIIEKMKRLDFILQFPAFKKLVEQIMKKCEAKEREFMEEVNEYATQVEQRMNQRKNEDEVSLCITKLQKYIAIVQVFLFFEVPQPQLNRLEILVDCLRKLNLGH